jgi:N utilization substance protein B
LALALLFQWDAVGGAPLDTVRLFTENFDPKNDKELSLELEPEKFNASFRLATEFFFGVINNLQELDKDIREVSTNWTLERMSRVDVALIRLAYYEMRHREDIPFKVSIDEAIELAKTLGDRDSGAFVNGILDQLCRKLEGQLALGK